MPRFSNPSRLQAKWKSGSVKKARRRSALLWVLHLAGPPFLRKPTRKRKRGQAEFPEVESGRRPIMSIIKKAPAILAREFRIEEPVSALLDDYAQFIESSPDHVINSALKKTLWRDQDYRKWREQRRNSGGEAARHGSTEGPAKP